MNYEAFLNSLYIMGEGMLGILIVTGVLILSVYLIRKIGSKKQSTTKTRQLINCRVFYSNLFN